jgi:hypothetical protein
MARSIVQSRMRMATWPLLVLTLVIGAAMAADAQRAASTPGTLTPGQRKELEYQRYLREQAAAREQQKRPSAASAGVCA